MGPQSRLKKTAPSHFSLDRLTVDRRTKLPRLRWRRTFSVPHRTKLAPPPRSIAISLRGAWPRRIAATIFIFTTLARFMGRRQNLERKFAIERGGGANLVRCGTENVRRHLSRGS